MGKDLDIMQSYNSYEERNISAFCRLSFEVWHANYKDCISVYLDKCESLDLALKKYTEKTGLSRTVKVDGVACLNKYNLEKCIKAFLDFLYLNEDYDIVVALPFEKMKEAEAMSYSYTNSEIEVDRIDAEMREFNYVLMVWSIPRNSVRYLKILPDKTAMFAVRSSLSRVVRGKFELDEELYDQLVDWAKKTIDSNRRTEICEGQSMSRNHVFEVSFNIDALEYRKSNGYFSGFGFNDIEGHGAITELLKKPEVHDFVEGAGLCMKIFC